LITNIDWLAFCQCESLKLLEFVHPGTVEHAPMRYPYHYILHVPMVRMPIGLTLSSDIFGGPPEQVCPALQIRIRSYGWGRFRALHPKLLRRAVITRAVGFFWYRIAVERHCAPGGRLRELDRQDFLAKFGMDSTA